MNLPSRNALICPHFLLYEFQSAIWYLEKKCGIFLSERNILFSPLTIEICGKKVALERMVSAFLGGARVAWSLATRAGADASLSVPRSIDQLTAKFEAGRSPIESRKVVGQKVDF